MMTSATFAPALIEHPDALDAVWHCADALQIVATEHKTARDLVRDPRFQRLDGPGKRDLEAELAQTQANLDRAVAAMRKALECLDQL